MRRQREQRPKGRKMPHPDEARNADGTIDLAKAKAGMDEAMAAFAAGEFQLVDMDEVEIAGTDLELFIVTRRRLKK
jgi:hypothetical protein